MAQTISFELYELLVEKLGKEEAKKVVTAIEKGFEVIEKRAEEVALQKKLEIKEELTKELATKADIVRLEGEISLVRQELQTVKIELEGKIERLNQKFTFMLILLIIALTLMNPVAAELMKSLLRFLRLI